MAKFKIALLPGDGIGKDVTDQGIRVLGAIAKKFKHEFIYKEALVGGVAIDETGDPFPKETELICKKSDAVFFGAVGDPKFDQPGVKIRPEQGLLRMRKNLGLYANLRPVKVYDSLINISTLKPKILKDVDIVILRELTGDLYFGEPRGRRDNGQTAFETAIYTRKEIERIAHLAFKIALKRKKHVTSVDKANVLETSRYWWEVVNDIAKQYPKVTLDHYYIDIATLQLVKNPAQFDVMLCTNMFGDIISDEAAILSGSMGMMASASLSEGKLGLYEPVHGSAPKYKGQNKVNPLATILSAALMLRYSFALEKEALTIEKAVEKTLSAGFRTYDIMEKGCKLQTTSSLTDKIIKNIK